MKKRREWTHRLMLEAADHDRKSFVTLTYDDDNIPSGNSLSPSDLSRFLKRFRKSIHPLKLRYFAVGEYGETTKRPHYHLALFGYPACDKGITARNRSNYCCPVCERVQRDWSMGNVHIGQLEESSAAYVAGYVTKKLRKPGEEYDERLPEFTRMSLRPGIGANYSDEVADVLLKHRLDQPQYVPQSLAHGKHQLPIGRYIRNRVRERIGVSKEEMARFVKENENEEVRKMREIAFENAPPGSKAFAFKQALIEHNQGAIIRAKSKLKRSKNETI